MMIDGGNGGDRDLDKDEQRRRHDRRRYDRSLNEQEIALIETTTRHLVRVLRRRIDDVTQEFSQASAAALVSMQVCRKERPGSRLGVDARERLRAEIDAQSLSLDPTRQKTVVAFARAVATCAVRSVPARATVNQRALQHASPYNTRALATAAVRAEVLVGDSNEDIVRRAVLRMAREKRRGRVGHRTLVLDDSDPLKDLLDLPATRSSLLRQDIRHRMVGGKLGDLLREASRFSDVTLREFLGEELWALGRPVGFSDSRQKTVLIEVKSDAVAHALSMRKPEILARLKAAPGLDNIKDIRFMVETPDTLPVVGRRPVEPAPTLDDVLRRMRQRSNKKSR